MENISDSNLEEENYEQNFEHELQTNTNDIPKNNHLSQCNDDPKLLKHKSHRDKEIQSNHNKSTSNDIAIKHNTQHPNRKKSLYRLLEFYFSDINLTNDKFLRKVTKRDPEHGVDVNIILRFNKVKDLLKGIEKNESKISLIKNACEMSKLIKFCNNKIFRIKKFDLNSVNMEEIDNKTIYVQNLPSTITHDDLIKIFSNADRKVSYVSLPKFVNDSQKLAKGFAFITFESEKDACNAIKELNNAIPKEIIHLHPRETLPLELITKSEWLKKKEEFKNLKRQLQNEQKELFADCLGIENNEKNNLIKGTIVKLSELPSHVDKNDIKIFISHLVEPAYVDYNSPDQSMCIVRFSHAILAESFLKKIENDDLYRLKGKKIRANRVEGEEEEEYMKKVEQLKKQFQFKKKKKEGGNK